MGSILSGQLMNIDALRITDRGWDSISNYNVIGGLSGLGIQIFHHTIHEMKNGKDILNFVLSTKAISDSRNHARFKWSIAPAMAIIYPLQAISGHKTELVCFHQIYYRRTDSFLIARVHQLLSRQTQS